MSNGKSPDRNAVALIAGPTASGKSDLAVELSLYLERRGDAAVVINADSAQVYADLAVLSARPTIEEMRGVPHRLFGMWDGATACSAADWARAAKEEIARAQADSALPILVGGTGLYLRTLLDGIAPIPAIDPAIRAEVRALPVAETYKALQSEDPERAAALNAADTTRVARALEIIRSTGRPMAYWQQQLAGGIGDKISLHPLVLLPERDLLFERCDLRFARMVERGAVDEVAALLTRDLNPDLPVMRAIGVPEIAGALRGDWLMKHALAQGQQATRNYAKRQYTWFRNQPPQNWPRVTLETYDMRSEIETLFPYFGLT
jgi:tRNA dimethylallyltransferase